MAKISYTGMVTDIYVASFLGKLNKMIDTIQEDGLDVEVQYQYGFSYNKEVYSAVLIGREKE